MKALTWLKQKMASGSPEVKEVNADIRVIGDRRAGKTVYMASLAYWPNANPDSPVQSVTPIGEAANQDLLKYAQDILEQGLEIKGTPLNATVDEVKNYCLSILLKEQFQWSKLNSQPIQLTINCKDYAGEFFSDLLNKSSDPLLKDYLNDCLRATGILFLVDGTAYAKDRQYALSLDNFLDALNQANTQQKRIAVTLSKCELAQLWLRRHEPKGLTKSLFPQMTEKLETWTNKGLGFVDYFTVSAFGRLGKEASEPNTTFKKRDKGGTNSVIREPKYWKPFGLVSPIYWLCTNQRHKALDED